MLDRLRELIFRDRLGRWAGAAFFTLWIGQRVYLHYRPTLLWWLITLQFALFILAYLTRLPARHQARGFWEVFFPFFCAALPLALDDYPFKPMGRPIVPSAVVIGLLLAGTLTISLGVAFLRRSFSIMAEVRAPIFGGIYRYTRHPMYLGSIIGALGLLLQGYSWLNLVIFIVFIALQVLRAGIEERKIAAAYPEYAGYAARVGWLGPIGVGDFRTRKKVAR